MRAPGRPRPRSDTIGVVSELERLRTEIDEASRAVAELTRDVEQLTEQRARSEKEARHAEQALLDAEREASSVSFGAHVAEKIGQGWGFLGKASLMIPLLVLVGVFAALFFQSPDVVTELSMTGTGSLIRTDGPSEELGGACDVSVAPLGEGRFHAVLTCDGRELYAGEVGCALERRCSGSGDDETCWNALLVTNEEVGRGFFFDSDVGLVQADLSGSRVAVATHVVDWSGEP
jgi:hypothetical protein